MDLFALVGILVISGIFIGSVGIFCSAVIRKTTVATIASYVIVVLLTLGILILLTGSHYILNVRAEQMGNFEGVDIGKWVYLLYLNPLVIYFGLLSNQVGSGCELLQICSRFGEYTNDFGVVHMLGIAVGVQLLIPCFFCIWQGKVSIPCESREAYRCSSREAGIFRFPLPHPRSIEGLLEPWKSEPPVMNSPCFFARRRRLVSSIPRFVE